MPRGRRRHLPHLFNTAGSIRQVQYGRFNTAGSIRQVQYVMPQRGELLLLVPAGSRPHTSQSLRHASPALCPERVGLFGVPLGRTASLHALRRGLPLVVRTLRWYYLLVRLPTGVRAGLIAHRLLPPIRRVAPGRQRGLPVLAQGVFRHAGGLGTARGSRMACVYRRPDFAFRRAERRRRPGRRGFRCSIPRLPVPLSTLRPWPHSRPRMTRGQDGSLLLSCRTLSFPTPCRFIPAHSASLRPGGGNRKGGCFIVKTWRKPLLKTKGLATPGAPKCEGWVSLKIR